jgi:hypothetical protein
MPPRLLGVLLLSILSGIAACGPPPEATPPKRRARPAAPSPVAEVQARTIVELQVADPLTGFVEAELPEAVVRALRRPESAESRLAEWVDALRSPEVLSRASHEAGSTLAPDDVRVERSGSRFEITVVGSNGDAATARCLALIRGARTWEKLRRAGAVESWIRAERQRALAELAKIEESTRTLSLDGGEEPARTIDEERARLRGRSAAIVASPPGGTEMLTTLARSIERAHGRGAELRAMGLGDHHPEVRAADAHTRALEAFVGRQRDAELEADRAVLAQLDAIASAKPDRPSATLKDARLRKARLQAQAKVFEQPVAEGAVASFAPLALRLLVSEQREVVAARAAAAETLGADHPRRALLDAELAIVTRKIELERQATLAAVRQEIADLDAPRPPASGAQAREAPAADPRAEQARQLRSRLVRLVVQLEDVEGRLGVPEVEVKIALPCGAH